MGPDSRENADGDGGNKKKPASGFSGETG